MNKYAYELLSRESRILPGQALKTWCSHRGYLCGEYVYRKIDSEGNVTSIRPGNNPAVGLTFSGARSLSGPQRSEVKVCPETVRAYFGPRTMAKEKLLLPRFGVEDTEGGDPYFLPNEKRSVKLRLIKIPFLEIPGEEVYNLEDPEAVHLAIKEWENKVLDAVGSLYFPDLYILRQGSLDSTRYSASEPDPTPAYSVAEEISLSGAIDWVSGASTSWVPDGLFVFPEDNRSEEERDQDELEEVQDFFEHLLLPSRPPTDPLD